MRCLILGGAGFLGSHIVNCLFNAGHFVRLLDIKPNPYWSPPSGVECCWADWNDYDQINHAIKDIDVVVHLICTSLPEISGSGIITDLTSNLVPSLQLFHLCQQKKIKKVIFLSSGGTVYGIPKYLPIDEFHSTSPISSYGIVKLFTEKYLHLFYHTYGLNFIILRGANVYGEYQNPIRSQGVVNVFLGRLAHSQPLDIWGDGQVIRDFLYVGDLARAVKIALESDVKAEIFNLGSGEGTSINQLIETIQALTGKKYLLKYRPARVFDVPANVLAVDKIKTNLNWYPETTLSEGISQTWEWTRKIIK